MIPVDGTHTNFYRPENALQSDKCYCGVGSYLSMIDISRTCWRCVTLDGDDAF